MRRRMGRPGLIGTMARTAVIAGTATAVTGGVRGRQAAAQQQAAQQPAAPAPTAVPETATAAAPPQGDNMIAELERLAQLKTVGVLNDAEFAAAKAKLLNL